MNSERPGSDDVIVKYHVSITLAGEREGGAGPDDHTSVLEHIQVVAKGALRTGLSMGEDATVAPFTITRSPAPAL